MKTDGALEQYFGSENLNPSQTFCLLLTGKNRKTS